MLKTHQDGKGPIMAQLSKKVELMTLENKKKLNTLKIFTFLLQGATGTLGEMFS